MKQIKCAVVGVGYLGKFHAQKYAALDSCKLLAVVDVDRVAADKVAAEYQTVGMADYRELLGKVDAVSVAVPTALHSEITVDFLRSGAHVLVEKPMATTIEQADAMINAASKAGVILQVGHIERFNPVIMGLTGVEKPLFIEAHRLACFNPRANDVSVVLDLMIHDIDIILALVDDKIERIDASGSAVLTQGIDIANARLSFASGCVANVTASRISMKNERKMRLFRPRSYVSVDFQNKTISKYATGSAEMFPGIAEIITTKSTITDSDALAEEIAHFVNCIKTSSNPLVSGIDGKKALQTAIQITDLLMDC